MIDQLYRRQLLTLIERWADHLMLATAAALVLAGLLIAAHSLVKPRKN